MDIPLAKMKIDPKFYRPAEIPDIYGSNRLAKKELGWRCQEDFYKILDILIAEEEKNSPR